MPSLRTLIKALPVALVALSLDATGVDAANLAGLMSGHFVAVPRAQLPAGAVYDDATCPSAFQCYLVGDEVTASGVHGVVTSTANGGRTWRTRSLPETAGLDDYAISCPSGSVCYAAGTAAPDGPDQSGRAVMLTTHTSGQSWGVERVPTGSAITSIGCATATSCIAVGSNSNVPESTMLSTTNGGTTWVHHPAPANNITTVRCIDLTHCWAAGPGAWFTANLGTTWTNRSPPSSSACPTSGFGVCSTYWSETVDIEFQSDADGWVVGGDQCGGEGATQCAGVAFHTTDGGTSWTLSKGSTSYPFNWQIACQSSACLLVGQAFTHSTIAWTKDSGKTWQEMQQVGTAINALTCNPERSFCLAAGGSDNVPALLTLGRGAVPASTPASSPLTSTVGTSLATPQSLIASPLNALVNALITVGLILLITFPSQLFNRTYDENHEAIRDWWEAHLRWMKRLRDASQRVSTQRRRLLGAALVLVLGGVLATLLQPTAGFNLRSLALFIGAALAIVAGVAVTGLAAGLYRSLRHKVGEWHIRALPSALLVACVCVLISRLTDFEPGYLYGLIGGVAFTGRLTKHEEGHEVAASVACTLVVSVVAWLFWVPVETATAANPSSFPLAVAENFLAALFLSGMVGLVVGLVPLRFLPGARLKAWHLGVWTAAFGVVALTLLEVILQPETHAVRHTSDAAFWTTTGLFIAFGAASIAFWGYFRRREPASAPA